MREKEESKGFIYRGRESSNGNCSDIRFAGILELHTDRQIKEPHCQLLNSTSQY